MNAWDLPESAEIGGTTYPLNADFRDVLEIIAYLNDEEMPEYMRWQIAVALFFEGEIPNDYKNEAAKYLADFICCGDASGKPGPKLLDWEQDAQIIVADVNKVAGIEIRAVPFLHWWTFLGYFHAIGEGQLATIVAIRNKKKRGKKLEKWEQEYYRENKEKIDFKIKLSAHEQKELEDILKYL